MHWLLPTKETSDSVHRVDPEDLMRRFQAEATFTDELGKQVKLLLYADGRECNVVSSLGPE